MSKKITIIDLSTSIENFANEPWPPEIVYWDHYEWAKNRARQLGLKVEDFPDKLAGSCEKVTLVTHAGTHLDAPWHFGPKVGDDVAKTIDQIPLEWCYSDGVVLDLRHKKANESITMDDIKVALSKIGYEIKPYDIVLIMTGADKYLEDPNYINMHPGMSREATLWLIDRGVKIIGTDGYGFDKGTAQMVKEYKSGDKGALWPAHFAGREKEYCHIEKLTNLDKLLKPYGFKVAVFPVKIAKASGGWCRPVAILEDE